MRHGGKVGVGLPLFVDALEIHRRSRRVVVKPEARRPCLARSLLCRCRRGALARPDFPGRPSSSRPRPGARSGRSRAPPRSVPGPRRRNSDFVRPITSGRGTSPVPASRSPWSANSGRSRRRCRAPSCPPPCCRSQRRSGAGSWARRRSRGTASSAPATTSFDSSSPSDGGQPHRRACRPGCSGQRPHSGGLHPAPLVGRPKTSATDRPGRALRLALDLAAVLPGALKAGASAPPAT